MSVWWKVSNYDYGQVGRVILSKRGLRQGNPLSPSLFALGADVFTRILRDLGPEGFSQKVLSLQYVDETLLFCRTEEHYLRTLKVLVYGFEMASGLKINFNKSCVFVGGES